MSDDNPWVPSTVIKDGETIKITGMVEPKKKYVKYSDFLSITDLVSSGNLIPFYGTGIGKSELMQKYLNDDANLVFGPVAPITMNVDYGSGLDWLNLGKPQASIYPELAEPEGVDGATASAFIQHHWGTPNVAINNISITKLLVGYAEFISKDLTMKLTADIKKKQRDACVPRHKKNARKFRPE